MNSSSPTPLNLTQSDLDSVRRQIEEINTSEVFSKYLTKIGYEGAKLKFQEDEEHLNEIVANGLDYPIILLSHPVATGRENIVCSFEMNIAAVPGGLGGRKRTAMTFQPEVSVLSSHASRHHPEEWDVAKLGQPEKSLGAALNTFIVETFKESLTNDLQSEGETRFWKEQQEASVSLQAEPMGTEQVREGEHRSF